MTMTNSAIAPQAEFGSLGAGESLMQGTVAHWPLRQMVQCHGSSSSAYFVLQPGVSSFGDASMGVVVDAAQWTPSGHVHVVFTNPLCSDEALEPLLDAYIAHRQGRILFLGVDRRVSELLSRKGFFSNHLGTESFIDLRRFSVAGKSMKQLRHAANFGKRHRAVVREQLWSQVDGEAVRRISEAWRSQKRTSTRELRLLTRPPEFRDEWGTRKFYCYQGDSLLGYVFFDPYFQNGKVLGYCANIIRSRPEPEFNGVCDYLVLEAIKQFQSEGVSQLSLGLSPLHRLASIPHERAGLRRLASALYHYGNRLYAFQGLAYHKTRYRPQEEARFLCGHQSLSSLAVVFTLLSSTAILPFTGISS